MYCIIRKKMKIWIQNIICGQFNTQYPLLFSVCYETALFPKEVFHFLINVSRETLFDLKPPDVNQAFSSTMLNG